MLAHLCLLLAVAVMLRLGLWQWDRANSPTGGLQNYAYAMQWPLFAVFAIVVYVKTAHIELHRDLDVPRAGSPSGQPVPADSGVIRQPGLRIGVSTPPVDIDETDEEMLAYNARFAALNAASSAVESRGRGR
jgi:hypothetical protein